MIHYIHYQISLFLLYISFQAVNIPILQILFIINFWYLSGSFCGPSGGFIIVIGFLFCLNLCLCCCVSVSFHFLDAVGLCQESIIESVNVFLETFRRLLEIYRD